MHILYLHQYFAVPSGSTGTRSYEFARRWIKKGHQVTLITANCDISGLEMDKGVVQKQTIEGIDVIIAGIKYSNKHSFIHRIASFLCFMFFSIYAGSKVKDVDVIYATSTPLTIGVPAMVLKWLKRAPFVFEVRDQWPAVPVGMGIIKNKLLIRILLWFEKTIYRQSAAIVALSPGMADGVSSVLNGLEREVTIIPNSSDTEVFKPDIDGSDIRRENGWENKLVFLHAGAMGMANGLDFVVDVADRLKDRDDIHFVLVGRGSQQEALIERIEKSELTNMSVQGSVSKDKLPEVFAACDVSIVIFANYPVLEHNSANKFFDSLSAGKPILLNYSGWQKPVVEENQAGFGCNLYDIDEFVEKVLYYNSNRDKLAEMGENARNIAVERFNRDNLARQALEVIESAVR